MCLSVCLLICISVYMHIPVYPHTILSYCLYTLTLPTYNVDFAVLERNVKSGYYDKALPGVIQGNILCI